MLEAIGEIRRMSLCVKREETPATLDFEATENLDRIGLCFAHMS